MLKIRVLFFINNDYKHIHKYIFMYVCKNMHTYVIAPSSSTCNKQHTIHNTRNMPKYHILKNNDFHNNLYDDDDSTAKNVNAATMTLGNNEENSDIFYKMGGNHHSEGNALLEHENLVQQQRGQRNYFQNHFFKDEDHCQSESHKRDLIQNNNSINTNNNKNIYNTSNDTDTYADTTAKTKFISNRSSINLTRPLDSAEEYTMEIPLLQQNFNNNNNNGDRRTSCENNHFHNLECVCLCQQKGFASNLNNNATQSAKSKILWAIALCCVFMVVEFLGGYIAGSLAIMADAAHLASDCISFVIGLVSIWLGCKPPDAKMSFGYKRFEVMGAIVSILGIWILTATLVLVAIQHIYSNDYYLDANTMMTISGIGILINIIMIFILHTSVLDLPAGTMGSSHGHSHSHNHNSHHGHSHSHTRAITFRPRNNDGGHLHTEYATRTLLPTDRDVDGDISSTDDAIDTGEGISTSTSIQLSSPAMVLNENLKDQQDGNDKNLNLRAAMIHVIGDLVQSFGVFLAAVLIKIFPKAAFLDPFCTLLFSIIVIMTTINLFKESMHLIMDSVPKGLSIDNLEMDLLNIEGVKSVHHLNVWNHTSNFSILMAHLVIDILIDSNTVLMQATNIAGSAKYNIKHSTIQIERMTS